MRGGTRRNAVTMVVMVVVVMMMMVMIAMRVMLLLMIELELTAARPHVVVALPRRRASSAFAVSGSFFAELDLANDFGQIKLCEEGVRASEPTAARSHKLGAGALPRQLRGRGCHAASHRRLGAGRAIIFVGDARLLRLGGAARYYSALRGRSSQTTVAGRRWRKLSPAASA